MKHLAPLRGQTVLMLLIAAQLFNLCVLVYVMATPRGPAVACAERFDVTGACFAWRLADGAEAKR